MFLSWKCDCILILVSSRSMDVSYTHLLNCGKVMTKQGEAKKMPLIVALNYYSASFKPLKSNFWSIVHWPNLWWWPCLTLDLVSNITRLIYLGVALCNQEIGRSWQIQPSPLIAVIPKDPTRLLILLIMFLWHPPSQ